MTTPPTPTFHSEARSYDSFTSSSGQDLTPRDYYRLLTSLIIPRPIAWITTVNQEGLTNLAPFSYFNAVASNPPVISISFAHKPDGSSKDTLANILATKEFVVNACPSCFLNHVPYTGSPFPSEVSELDTLNLPTHTSHKVKAPRLAQSPWHLECSLYQSIPVGEAEAPGASTLILGKVECHHLSPEILNENGRIDARALDPLARLGGLSYSTLGDIFERKIPGR